MVNTETKAAKPVCLACGFALAVVGVRDGQKPKFPYSFSLERNNHSLVISRDSLSPPEYCMVQSKQVLNLPPLAKPSAVELTDIGERTLQMIEARVGTLGLVYNVGFTQEGKTETWQQIITRFYQQGIRLKQHQLVEDWFKNSYRSPQDICDLVQEGINAWVEAANSYSQMIARVNEAQNSFFDARNLSYGQEIILAPDPHNQAGFVKVGSVNLGVQNLYCPPWQETCEDNLQDSFYTYSFNYPGIFWLHRFTDSAGRLVEEAQFGSKVEVFNRQNELVLQGRVSEIFVISRKDFNDAEDSRVSSLIRSSSLFVLATCEGDDNVRVYIVSLV